MKLWETYNSVNVIVKAEEKPSLEMIVGDIFNYFRKENVKFDDILNKKPYQIVDGVNLIYDKVNDEKYQLTLIVQNSNPKKLVASIREMILEKYAIKDAELYWE